MSGQLTFECEIHFGRRAHSRREIKTGGAPPVPTLPIGWKDKSVGKSAVTYADGHIYVRSERGAVALVEANPKEYKETGRFNQPERNREAAWAHPVVAGGKLYLMDQDLCFCYDIKEK